jgi:hypothetical protein
LIGRRAANRELDLVQFYHPGRLFLIPVGQGRLATALLHDRMTILFCKSSNLLSASFRSRYEPDGLVISVNAVIEIA